MLPELDYRPPVDPYVTILFCDESVVVLSKQSGLLSVPGKSPLHADCLESRVIENVPDALTVHRLDKDTSGLMVMGRGKASHRNLSMQFERRHVRKAYRAKVWGRITENEGNVALPLRCDWPNRPLQIVDHALGKPAETRWRVVERDEATTLVDLFPKTGRSHQLRVHLMALGHPILGDAFYAHVNAKERSKRLLLHATALSFIHPGTGERVNFEEPSPF